MPRLNRWIGGALLTGASLVAFGASSVGAAPSGKHDSGVVYAALTHTVGSTDYIAGNSTDKLFGSGAVTYTTKVGIGSKPGTLKVTVKPVTTFYKNGALSGTATATLVTNSDLTVTITGGKLNETKGTGAEKGHRFIATFTGTGKSVTGPFVFHYKGTYK
jgi:hypothetical protein